MTEDDVRRIVREEVEAIGGLDIGEVIALQVRTTAAGMLKQVGVEEFLRAWSPRGGRGQA